MLFLVQAPIASVKGPPSKAFRAFAFVNRAWRNTTQSMRAASGAYSRGGWKPERGVAKLAANRLCPNAGTQDHGCPLYPLTRLGGRGGFIKEPMRNLGSYKAVKTKEKNMGYSTKFSGELKFTVEPTASQLAALKSMCGEDCREHPEWNATGIYYIDLELTDDFSGLRWNGAEKTYYLDKLVNVVICEMRKKWPDFGLSGALEAQGEDVEDRWALSIGEDGFAYKTPIALTGKVVTCPHCGDRFALEG